VYWPESYIEARKMVLPEQGENFQSWKWDELSVRARQHTVQDVLAM
jgi:hypothetical protein